MKDVIRKIFTVLSSVVQSLNRVKTLHVTPWTAACQACLCFTISRSFLKLMSIESWYHPTISSSVTLFSSLQPFLASGSFPISQLFSSGGQSIGASASASVLLLNIQGWFPLGLTHLISLLSKTLKSLLQHTISKASILWHSAFFMVQLSHPNMINGKTIAFNFLSKVMFLLLNMPNFS